MNDGLHTPSQRRLAAKKNVGSKPSCDAGCRTVEAAYSCAEDNRNGRAADGSSPKLPVVEAQYRDPHLDR